jgi:hypothetical protein
MTLALSIVFVHLLTRQRWSQLARLALPTLTEMMGVTMVFPRTRLMTWRSCTDTTNKRCQRSCPLMILHQHRLHFNYSWNRSYTIIQQCTISHYHQRYSHNRSLSKGDRNSFSVAHCHQHWWQVFDDHSHLCDTAVKCVQFSSVEPECWYDLDCSG